MTVALVVLLGLAVNLVIGWLENALVGRPKLRRFADRQGLTLLTAKWRPMVVIRTAMYDVTVQQADGHRLRGRAYVGGPWTGPVWSSQIELKLHDMTPADD